ncbi:hypothetical protein ACLB2K_016205 [Fragaria x ananassa]
MSEKFMHTVQYDGYRGGTSGLKHVEVPIPTPIRNEVLVKLEAASLNPVDWKIQKGQLRPLFPLNFPLIPLTDVSGEIVEVGEGVKKFKYGGGLAQFAVTNKRLMVARPPERSSLKALARSRKNILVTAASGGVGHCAVQLAKLGNAHVTATCGARNIDLVKSLGADEVLDYKTPDGAALKSPSGRKYDAVIHCATSIPWSTFERNLSAKGKVIYITPGPSAFSTCLMKMLTFSKKKLVPLMLYPKTENLECLVKLVKEGKLKTVIDSRHPLSKAEDAWAKSIDGHATGKIIVEIS